MTSPNEKIKIKSTALGSDQEPEMKGGVKNAKKLYSAVAENNQAVNNKNKAVDAF